MQNRIAQAWASGEMEKGMNAVKEWLKEYENSQCQEHEFHGVSPVDFGMSSLLDALCSMTGCYYNEVSESLAAGNISGCLG